MSKPTKLKLSTLESIFGSNLRRSQDAELLSKYPEIPRGRQFRDLKGTVEEVALRVANERRDSLYIGFRLNKTKSNSNWVYTPTLFNVKAGKVHDYAARSDSWKDFEDVKYAGIELPKQYRENRDYRNLWFNKSFVASNSPLALIEVIPKEIKK